MTDEDAISFAQFVTDRFYGSTPEEYMLLYAYRDWLSEMNREQPND